VDAARDEQSAGCDAVLSFVEEHAAHTLHKAKISFANLPQLKDDGSNQ